MYYLFKNQRAFCSLVFFILMSFKSVFASSNIDAHFKIKAKSRRHQQRVLRSQDSDILILYQQFFAKSMYSKCRWFPSDSGYLKLKSLNCGSGVATLKSIGRFLDEFDADKLTLDTIVDQGHRKFFDFDEGCDVF